MDVILFPLQKFKLEIDRLNLRLLKLFKSWIPGSNMAWSEILYSLIPYSHKAHRPKCYSYVIVLMMVRKPQHMHLHRDFLELSNSSFG